MIQLSPSQIAAEKSFQEFLESDEKEMVITGAAGTGKSTLVKHLHELVQKYNQLCTLLGNKPFKDIQFTATTNKAAKVLADVMAVDVSTIHSFLNLRVTNDYKTGKTNLTTTKDTRQINRTLLFIDEVSMIGADLWAIIRQCIGEHTKVVYIGDPYQLAPVQESKNCIFTAIPRTVHLKEIQRQLAGNPIIELSSKFKAILDTGFSGQWPEIQAIPDYVVLYNNKQEFVDAALQHLSVRDTDTRILAWTNDAVHYYNDHIKAKLYGTTDFVPGETVVTNKPVMSGRSVLYPTDHELYIRDIAPAEFTIADELLTGHWVTLPNYAVQFMPLDRAQVKALSKRLAKDKDWYSYFQVQETLLDLRPVFAQTSHKSQGSTYDTVFIDMEDIGKSLQWAEICRLVYVAMTRTRTSIHLYGQLPLRNWKHAQKSNSEGQASAHSIILDAAKASRKLVQPSPSVSPQKARIANWREQLKVT